MADTSRYRRTMTPITLGPVEIPNRFYLSPHGVGYNVGYEPSDVFAEYPRGLTAAIQDGHRYARAVGEPDGPRTFTDLYFAPVDFGTYQRPAWVLLAE